MNRSTYGQLLKVAGRCYADGFAIAVFTPEELNGVDIDKVIDAMIEAGWDIINREIVRR